MPRSGRCFGGRNGAVCEVEIRFGGERSTEIGNGEVLRYISRPAVMRGCDPFLA